MKDRVRTRINAEKKATLTGPKASLKGVIENISLKGTLLKTGREQGFGVGEEAELVIHLEPENPEFDIRAKCTVVRRGEDVIALDFTEINPDSFHHLLRFVQYNADNPEIIEKELGTMAYAAK